MMAWSSFRDCWFANTTSGLGWFSGPSRESNACRMLGLVSTRGLVLERELQFNICLCRVTDGKYTALMFRGARAGKGRPRNAEHMHALYHPVLLFQTLGISSGSGLLQLFISLVPRLLFDFAPICYVVRIIEINWHNRESKHVDEVDRSSSDKTLYERRANIIKYYLKFTLLMASELGRQNVIVKEIPGLAAFRETIFVYVWLSLKSLPMEVVSLSEKQV